jgi:hypothetical protein
MTVRTLAERAGVEGSGIGGRMDVLRDAGVAPDARVDDVPVRGHA